MKFSPWISAALVAAAALSSGSAEARVRDRLPPSAEDDGRDPPEGFQPELSARAGVLCVKQCPDDRLPCDPPSYKIADGRCATQWR